MSPFGDIHTSDTITLSKSVKISQNWAKLKNTNNRKKLTGFRRAPCAKRYGDGISMASVQNSQRFRKNKMAAKKIGTFYGFRVLGNTFSWHSLWSGLHFALTKTTAICVYFSAASPKVLTLSKIWRGRCTLSDSLSKWEGHIDRLECGQLRLLTGVKGRKFETSSSKDTRDIHGRSGQHLRG